MLHKDLIISFFRIFSNIDKISSETCRLISKSCYEDKIIKLNYLKQHNDLSKLWEACKVDLNISRPGKYYFSSNIVCTINIGSSVSIDGKNFTLTGGIIIDNCSNIEIYNMKIIKHNEEFAITAKGKIGNISLHDLEISGNGIIHF